MRTIFLFSLNRKGVMVFNMGNDKIDMDETLDAMKKINATIKAKQDINPEGSVCFSEAKSQLAEYYDIQDVPRELRRRLRNATRSSTAVQSDKGRPILLTVVVMFILAMFIFLLAMLLEKPASSYIDLNWLALARVFTIVFISAAFFGIAAMVALWKQTLALGFPPGNYLLPGHYLEASDGQLLTLPLAKLSDCQVDYNPVNGTTLNGLIRLTLLFEGGRTTELLLRGGNPATLRQEVLASVLKIRSLIARNDISSLSKLDPCFDLPNLPSAVGNRSWFSEMNILAQAACVAGILGPLFSIILLIAIKR